MKRQDINLTDACSEGMNHLIAIAHIDSVHRHTYSFADLRNKDEVLSGLHAAMDDIPTHDLSNDRIDLLASVALDGLGSSPARLFVANAIRERLTERRERFMARLNELSRAMEGRWFEVDLEVDNIVDRSGPFINSPKPKPLYRGDTVAIKPSALRYEKGGAFKAYYNGTYGLFGIAQRGSGASTVTVKLVGQDGMPQATIRPLNGRPKKLTTVDKNALY